MQGKILQFVTKLADGKVASISEDANLFEEGILDSFGLVDLVDFLERETGLTLNDDDLNDARFTSVAGIAALVTEKMKGAGPLAKDLG